MRGHAAVFIRCKIMLLNSHTHATLNLGNLGLNNINQRNAVSHVTGHIKSQIKPHCSCMQPLCSEQYYVLCCARMNHTARRSHCRSPLYTHPQCGVTNPSPAALRQVPIRLHIGALPAADVSAVLPQNGYVWRFAAPTPPSPATKHGLQSFYPPLLPDSDVSSASSLFT